MSDFGSSLRIASATMSICVVGYTALVLGVAQTVTPGTANGSLVTNAVGDVVGSRLIAQSFTAPQHVWPRPSAVDFDAAGAGGSNLSPANPALAARAEQLIAAYGATETRPISADLVTASGGGLDPHISIEGALFQAERIAAARGVPVADVVRIMRDLAYAPGAFLTEGRIVNVLALNLALDAEPAAPAFSN